MTCNSGSDSAGDVDRLDEPSLGLLPERGVYTVVILLVEDEVIDVGSLGSVRMKRGLYAYTGSGLGQGALSLRGRVSRHLGRRKKLRWHIDYLTSSDSSMVVGVVASQAEKVFECVIASAINSIAEPVEGFGCSDCTCRSHLALMPFEEVDECLKSVEGMYVSLGLVPISLALRPLRVLGGHVGH
ncbi:MAG: GIY-YIG nuclease family protein [Candidatus Verstraetearchaeota archaeon]|jgi:Uri superfamily endonuclease|nr:GIY-YIG nuclease family protein [Candidatus Verstraetearchaeota archaeon]